MFLCKSVQLCLKCSTFDRYRNQTTTKNEINIAWLTHSYVILRKCIALRPCQYLKNINHFLKVYYLNILK